MILLDYEDYHKVKKPLGEVAINNLFARSVIEKHVNGKVFVDNSKHPKTFYVVHPYGMSLLFGESGNREFNRSFRSYALNFDTFRTHSEWMQAYPSCWDKVLSELFYDFMVKSENNNGKNSYNVIELNTRVNFKFNYSKYCNLVKTRPDNTEIVRAGITDFDAIKGSVVPNNFWDCREDFNKMGVGFCLYKNEKLASLSFSAFVHDKMIEIGIETLEEFRGQGLAFYACCALIDLCLALKLEPIWSCRLENIGSYKLALKLGFEPTFSLPYYRLCKSAVYANT